MNSKFLNINLRDLGHGALLAAGTVVTTALLPTLQSGTMPDAGAVKAACVAGAAAFVAYILKALFTNSSGAVFTKDSSTTLRMTVLALLIGGVSQMSAQWKTSESVKSVRSVESAVSESPGGSTLRQAQGSDGVVVDTVYSTSFAASLGYVSAAETFQGSRFYSGVLNIYQVIDSLTYLNFWTTIPGTHSLDQSFGLSYNRQLATPLVGMVLDWSAGVLASLPWDSLGKSWVGAAVGLRLSYAVVGPISVYAITDVVPAFDVNPRSPSGADKFGVTFMAGGGVTVTP